MFYLSEAHSNTLEYVLRDLPEMIVTQVELIIFSLFLAIIIGIPLGILAQKTSWGRKIIIPIANLLQTIPSLALFSILVPIAFFGVGLKNAVFVLFLYALMPIVYNTFLGLEKTDPNVIDAAQGIGLSKRQILLKVELPLALPLIMSGVRISAVINVGTSIIAAKVGAGGLGVLIFDGIDEQSYVKLIIGSLVSIALALIIDKLFAFFEHSLQGRGRVSKNRKNVAYSLMVLVLFIPSLFLTFNLTLNQPDIVVWSSGFTEQDIMAEMVKTLIEDETDYTVTINELGSSNLLQQETMASDMPAMYTTYTGTLYQTVYKHEERISSEEIYDVVSQDLQEDNLNISAPIGFNNTYTISMPRDITEEYNISKISDLNNYPNEFSIAATLASVERDDAIKGAIETYGLEFKEVIALDIGLRYSAISKGEVQAVDAFATDSQIVQYDLVVLDDDKDFFLPYDSVYIYNDYFDDLEGASETLDLLDDVISDDDMQKLNYQVNVEGKSPEQVAQAFLIDEGFIEE